MKKYKIIFPTKIVELEDDEELNDEWLFSISQSIHENGDYKVEEIK